MINRKSLNVVVLSFFIVALAGSALAAPATPASHGPVININTATVAQLALLPRVGQKVAGRIVEYRKANGKFAQATDLMQVKGIGSKSFELLRPYLVLDGETTLQTKQHAPRKAKSTSKSPTNPAQ